MRRVKLLIGDDRGSASLEFITAGVILLVPLVYLVIALAQIQSQSFGADATARYLARTIAQDPQATVLAQQNGALIAEQYGIDPDAIDVGITCEGAGLCPSSGSLVTITVTVAVALPLIPSALDSRGGFSVTVSAQSTHKVAEFVRSP